MNEELNNISDDNRPDSSVDDSYTAETDSDITSDDSPLVQVAAPVKKRSGLKKELMDWAITLIVAFLGALLLRNYVFTLVLVKGQSMEPTLQNGDFLAVVRLGYNPKQGDVVIFMPHNGSKEPYVKRVVALPDQKVFIDDATGRVYVDDREFVVPQITARTDSGRQKEYVVPEGTVFVLGDNRNNSRDSRSPDVGFVEQDAIMGKVMFRASFGTIK